MCRLFAQVCGEVRTAEHWLVDAQRSFKTLSRDNPDGAGLASLTRGSETTLQKWTRSAGQNPDFDRAARSTAGHVLIGHLRQATPGMGHVKVENGHPFILNKAVKPAPADLTIVEDGMTLRTPEKSVDVFAHNGAFDSKLPLERALGSRMSSVHGDTDSERYGTLLQDAIEGEHGTVPRAVRSTVGWMEDGAPAGSYNFLLGREDGLWAFRYPDMNGLYVREIPGPGGAHDAQGGATLIASDPLDHSPEWRQMAPGELLHIPVGERPRSHGVILGD
jgi:glutamine amidotransferase